MRLPNARRFSALVSSIALVRANLKLFISDASTHESAEIKLDSILSISTHAMRDQLNRAQKHSAMRDQEFMDQFNMPDLNRPMLSLSQRESIARILNSDSMSQESANDDEKE